jgi:class 3 adenylate cyclase
MDELREHGTTTPQTFQNVTIMFVDFVNFTQMDVSHDPARLFSELNDIYTHFDDIATKHRCERIKTIGDRSNGSVVLESTRVR